MSLVEGCSQGRGLFGTSGLPGAQLRKSAGQAKRHTSGKLVACTEQSTAGLGSADRVCCRGENSVLGMAKLFTRCLGIPNITEVYQEAMFSLDGLFGDSMTLWLLACLLTKEFQHFPGQKKKKNGRHFNILRKFGSTKIPSTHCLLPANLTIFKFPFTITAIKLLSITLSIACPALGCRLNILVLVGCCLPDFH